MLISAPGPYTRYRIGIELAEIARGERANAVEHPIGSRLFVERPVRVFPLPQEYRGYPRSERSLDGGKNLRFVFDQHVVIGWIGTDHLVEMLELVIEDQDIAIHFRNQDRSSRSCVAEMWRHLPRVPPPCRADVPVGLLRSRLDRGSRGRES